MIRRFGRKYLVPDTEGVAHTVASETSTAPHNEGGTVFIGDNWEADDLGWDDVLGLDVEERMIAA